MKSSTYIPCQKGIVWILVVAFLVTSTAGPASAIPQNIWDRKIPSKSAQTSIDDKHSASASPSTPLDPSQLVIPEAYGSIQEIYPSRDPARKDKWIIEIQDSHANYEAQTNIRNMLDFLGKPNSRIKVDMIAMEGAKGDVDMHLLRQAPDQKAKSQVAERFLKAAYFTGVEAYALTSLIAPPRVLGVEDKDLYFENLDAFRSAYKANQSAQTSMNAMKQALDTLKSQWFAGSALEFINESEAFGLDRSSLTQYVQYLRATAVKTQSDLAAYPQCQKIWESVDLEGKIDRAKVEVEKKALLESLPKRLVKEELSILVQNSLLFRTGKMRAWDFYRYLKNLASEKSVDWKQYPNLYWYIRTIEIYADFKMENLVEEMERLEEEIKKKVYQDPK